MTSDVEMAEAITAELETSETDAPKSDGKPNEGWDEALSKTWETNEAKPEKASREETVSEIEAPEATAAQTGYDEIFAPYKEQLSAAGVSGPDYVKHLVGVANRMEQDPAGTLFDLAQHYGLVEGQPNTGNAIDPATVAQMQQSWDRFSQANNDAAGLKARMGQHLIIHPQRNGESVPEALTRAYRAVKSQMPKGVKPNKAKGEPKFWRDEIEASWGELGYGGNTIRGR